MRRNVFCGPGRSAVTVAMAVALLGLGLAYSCKKAATAPPPVAALVKYPDEAVNVVIDRITADPGGHSFMEDLQQKMGRARWQNAITGGREGTVICVVPLGNTDASTISGFVAIEAGSLLKMKVYRADQHDLNDRKLGSGRSAALTDMFNYAVFGTQPQGGKMRINDTPEKVYYGEGGGGMGKTSSLYIITSCYVWTTCTGDGSGGCIGNVYTHRECVDTTVWTADSDYSSPGGSSGGTGSPGGGPSSGGVGNTDFIEPPKNKIADLLKYLSCFDQLRGGKLILYVDQPQPGSDNPFTLLGLMGHVFVGLEQTIDGNTVSRTFGFAADDKVNPIRTTAASTLGDDSGRHYDVKLTVNLNSEQFSNAVLKSILHQPVYDLENYNCTDFALDVALAAGKDLPRTVGYWYIGRGRNPGSFGQDLRAQPGVVTKAGNAPANSGTCD